MDKKNLKALPEMRKTLSVLLLSFFLATTFTACSSSEQAQAPEQQPTANPADSTSKTVADSTNKTAADTSRAVGAGQPTAAVPFGELDSVAITTDPKVNPVLAVRTGKLSTGTTPVEKITETGLGCEYFLPTGWKESKREYKNLVNYYHDNRISVTISVGKSMFDSLQFWSQVQEAMTYGKNQIPRSDWRFDPATEAKSKVTQSYIGRYQFGGKQYNTAFFRHGEYQFNLIIDHPINGLKEGESDIINYMMANFAAGEPTVEIPKPVVTSSQDAAVEEEPKATTTKPTKAAKVAKPTKKSKSKKATAAK